MAKSVLTLAAAACCIAVTASAIMWWRLPHDLHGDPRTLRERIAVLGERGVPMTLVTSGLVTLAAFILMIYLAPIATTGLSLKPTVGAVCAALDEVRRERGQ